MFSLLSCLGLPLGHSHMQLNCLPTTLESNRGTKANYAILLLWAARIASSKNDTSVTAIWPFLMRKERRTQLPSLEGWSLYPTLFMLEEGRNEKFAFAPTILTSSAKPKPHVWRLIFRHSSSCFTSALLLKTGRLVISPQDKGALNIRPKTQALWTKSSGSYAV